MQRDEITRLVVDALERVLVDDSIELPVVIDANTPLVGGSVIDSLGLVELVMMVEQRLRREHGVDVTLADERAMSQRHSPFRTVGTLAEFIEQLLREQSSHDA